MKRHLPQQIHLVVASGLLLVILVLLYRIVDHHNRRIDVTREKIHSLSSETIEVLKLMTSGPISVRAFFAPEDDARRQWEVFFKEVATHHPHFDYQFFDPDRSPSEAKRYRVDAYRTTVVEYLGRRERFEETTEEAFTNALIRLAHPKTRQLCFVTGHGEVSLSDRERSGLSTLKQTLEDRQYQLKEIQLTAKGIPEECDVVVMAGPRYELLPEEVDWLQKYPKKGKGFLLLVDPMDMSHGKSYVRLLEPFGLKMGENVVVDKVSGVFGGDFLVPMITRYADHVVTKRFHVATFLPIARTIGQASKVPVGVKVTELAFTSSGSWGETDLKKLEEGEAELDPARDSAGPLSMVAVSEIQNARIAAVGDSDFLTNAHLDVSGNKDFILNLLEWLSKDERLITFRSRESRFEPLFLKTHQSIGAATFAVGALPLTVLLTGSVGIWIRRQKV